jgi:hypothetical protein
MEATALNTAHPKAKGRRAPLLPGAPLIERVPQQEGERLLLVSLLHQHVSLLTPFSLYSFAVVVAQPQREQGLKDESQRQQGLVQGGCTLTSPRLTDQRPVAFFLSGHRRAERADDAARR